MMQLKLRVNYKRYDVNYKCVIIRYLKKKNPQTRQRLQNHGIGRKLNHLLTLPL